MRAVKQGAVLFALWVLWLVLFLGGSALLGPDVDPSSLSPQEASRSTLMAGIVGLIDLAIVGLWVSRARHRGLRLWLEALVVLYGVKTFSSMLETWYFVDEAFVPRDMLPSLFVMTLPLCVIWTGAVVWALGPKDEVPFTPVGAAGFGGAVAAGALLYPVLFFAAGYFIAWQSDAVRAYYGEPGEPLPFFAHLAATFRDNPSVILLEMFRGVLWLAIGWPVLRGTRGPWWVGGGLFALMMAFVQNSVHLLPNPLMPAEVRQWHFVETASSNFVFALLASALIASLAGKLRSSRTTLRASAEPPHDVAEPSAHAA